MIIDRRTFVVGAAAMAAVGQGKLFAQTRRLRVGVIGGGIIGASTAAQLAMLGADVTLFEREGPAAGATRASVAWINAVVDDPHYMGLRIESMKAWREDDFRYGMGAIWGGSLNWAFADNAKRVASVTKKAKLLEATDDKPRYLTAQEITSVSPGVYTGGDIGIAFQSFSDGHVDPIFATNRYLTIAKVHGAKIIYPCTVTGIMLKHGKLSGVATTSGAYELDWLVSAGGTDTPAVMALINRKLELLHKPGLVVHTKPQPFTTNKVFEASSLIEFKQYYDGRYLTSFTEGPPDLPVHAGVLSMQMQYPTEELRQQHGAMLIRRTSEYIPAIANAPVDKVIVGFRPYPLDNRPVAGPVPGVPGVYVLVTHSGITLAPILARYAAQEIMTGQVPPLLSPYRPDRFIKA